MVFRYVEVGSSPKEPDFDLFARVGRRGGGVTLSPGIIFVDLCSISQAEAVGQAPGPNFGRELAKNQEKLKYLILPIGPY